MPQSFLVVVGVVLASLVAFQQLQGQRHTQASLDSMTLQTAATIAAAERLSFLESLPFDEAVKAAPAATVAALTPVVGGLFVRAGLPDLPDDDLDDFNGRAIVTSAALVEGAPPQPLTATVTVRYVSEANLAATSLVPTRFKEATVLVTTPGAPPVRLTQLFSCAGHCSW